MKKIISALAVLLLALFVAASALGQTVGASQVKKKTNAGLVADSANALAVGIYRGTSAPATPVTGQLWCDTTASPCILKTYTGSAWEIPPNGSAVTQADLSSFPAAPTDGQIVWVRSLKRAVVYESASAAWYFLDATGRKASTTYTLAITGSPLTAPATSGSAAAGGSVSAGTHVCAVTVYNSTGGETTPGTPTSTLTATGGGNQTLSLTFTASGTDWRGKRVYCSKANTTTPLYHVATIDDTSTGSYDVTVADTSFGFIAPDKNFSRPLPSGWTAHVPTISAGGCGATASSILCFAGALSNPGASVSSPRAAYGLGDTPPDKWTAKWKTVQYANGFGGGAFGYVQQPTLLAAAFADVTVVGTDGVGAYSYNGMPFGGIYTLRAGKARRNSATSFAWTVDDLPFFPLPGPISSMYDSWYMQVSRRKDGSGDSYWFLLSGDGVLWDTYATSGVTTSCAAAGIWCSGSVMKYVGISTERAGTGSAAQVTEITDFTWTSE